MAKLMNGYINGYDKHNDVIKTSLKQKDFENMNKKRVLIRFNPCSCRRLWTDSPSSTSSQGENEQSFYKTTVSTTGNGYNKSSTTVLNFASSEGNLELYKPQGVVHDQRYTYEVIGTIAKYLLDHTEIKPTVGIICGSGLGPLAETLTEKVAFPYDKIPHFPHSTVPGHAGKLVFGKLGNTSVVCMQGRFHSYEGYPLWKCSMPVRLMKLVGVTHLIVTNAAGGLNPEYNVGDIMIIKDHVNFMGFGGNNPLMGPNDERFGPRFFPMNRAYDYNLRQVAKTIANKIGMENCIREGVYTAIGGPNYETIAECRMLRVFGVDAVGMSTIPEVLTAKHAGMTVFAFSVITNKCIIEYDNPDEPTHKEVMDVAKLREPMLKVFVSEIVKHISNIT